MVNHDLYYFNPTCEIAIANGSETFVAAKILREFEKDLSLLPMVLSKPGDFILMPEKPSTQLISELQKINFPITQPITKTEIKKNKSLNFHKIIPWGWSPAVHFQLKEIKGRTSAEFQRSIIYNWKKEHRQLFERKTSALVCAQFIQKFGDKNYCNRHVIPAVIHDTKELKEYLKLYRDIVIKSPISSSGRGIQMIRNEQINDSNLAWAKSIFKLHGYLTAEPLLKKKLDLSFQFEINSTGKIIYHGTMFFFTNPNGMYAGHFINYNIEELLSPENSINEQLLYETGKKLEELLAGSIFSKNYEGFLGVDAMIIEDENQFKIHPCLEINCRLTMGMLALKIEKLIHPESVGRFEIFTATSGDFSSFVNEMKTKYPIKLKDKLFYSGFTALTDYKKSKKFGAYVLLD